MVGALSFDVINTLLGQSASYWHHPTSVNEGFAASGFFMTCGIMVMLAYNLAAGIGEFLLARFLPQRAGLLVIFFFVFSNFCGASTGLEDNWHLGRTGPAVYGLILTAIITWFSFPRPLQAREQE